MQLLDTGIVLGAGGMTRNGVGEALSCGAGGLMGTILF